MQSSKGFRIIPLLAHHLASLPRTNTPEGAPEKPELFHRKACFHTSGVQEGPPPLGPSNLWFTPVLLVASAEAKLRTSFLEGAQSGAPQAPTRISLLFQRGYPRHAHERQPLDHSISSTERANPAQRQPGKHHPKPRGRSPKGPLPPPEKGGGHLC